MENSDGWYLILTQYRYVLHLPGGAASEGDENNESENVNNNETEKGNGTLSHHKPFRMKLLAAI